MIKFFRRVRQRLVSQNRFSKYLLYAIGEIVLVVIGILIALKINNWNTERLNGLKENAILLEIKDNLKEDLKNIEQIQNNNTEKIMAIDSAFYFISQMKKTPVFGKEFSNLMPILTNYSLFNPTRVAINNVISSGNIDILKSEDLRKTISQYYSNQILDGIQDQIIATTQAFLDETAPQMINKTMMKSVTNLDFDVKPLEAITVYKNPYVLSDLFVMKNKTLQHVRILKKVETEINSLVTSIDNYLTAK